MTHGLSRNLLNSCTICNRHISEASEESNMPSTSATFSFWSPFRSALQRNVRQWTCPCPSGHLLARQAVRHFQHRDDVHAGHRFDHHVGQLQLTSVVALNGPGGLAARREGPAPKPVVSSDHIAVVEIDVVRLLVQDTTDSPTTEFSTLCKTVQLNTKYKSGSPNTSSMSWSPLQ